MAEDKRIRVSADASPLQELRQSAQALWNDFNKMENSFKDIADQTVLVIQKQIELLRERNILAVGGNWSGQGVVQGGTQTSLIDPYTGRPLFGQRGVESNVAGRLVSNQQTERQTMAFEKILSEVIRIADTLEKGYRDETNGTLPFAGDSGVPTEQPGVGGRISPVRSTLGETDVNGFLRGLRIPTSMSGLLGFLPIGGLLMSIGTMLGQQARFNAQQYGAENMFQRQNNIGTHWLLNMLTFGVSGAESQIKEIGRQAAAQNDRALSLYSSLRGVSYEQALAEQIGKSFSGEAVEGIIARDGGGEDIYSRISKLKSAWLDPHLPIESRNKAYSEMKQLQGEQSRRNAAIRRSKDSITEEEYHTFASENLGLNMTEYFEKVARLQRAGVVGGKTDVGTINQLLLAGRIRGLSEEDMSSVLAATRFDVSGRTGANIVQVFDTTLQRMGKDNQYIASTLSEYLRQFNRISESVLSRSGSINAETILRTMTSIQQATGMEGRQLERVQSSLMGANVSQDDVTQAILLRAARGLAPDASWSELNEMVENMPNVEGLPQAVYDMILKMTGGHGEMFRSVAKSAFNLSWADVNALDKGELTAEQLFGRGIAEGGQYSSETARSMVGAAERSSAGTTNRQIIQGYSEIFKQLGTSLAEVIKSIEDPIPVRVVSESTEPSKLVVEMDSLAKAVEQGVTQSIRSGFAQGMFQMTIESE